MQFNQKEKLIRTQGKREKLHKSWLQYRYTTMLEKIMLLVGTIVALITGAGLPLMSILQGHVSQAFINEQIVINQHGNTTSRGKYIRARRERNNFSPTTRKQLHKARLWARRDECRLELRSNDSRNVGCWTDHCDVLLVCGRADEQPAEERVCEGDSETRHLVVRHESLGNSCDEAFRVSISYGAFLASVMHFSNLERVKEGTGDKIGMAFQYLSQFVTGFIVAFVHSWRLTLVMLAITPVQVICGFAIAKSMSTFAIRETVRYAKAGKVVEETISSIRTVVSLNGLRYELDRYAYAVKEARKSGILKGLFLGISFGAMQATNFVSFALAFYIGVGWVHNGSMQFGDMLTTFTSVMMGSMALGLAGPQLAVLGTAQGAASSIYEVLDRVRVSHRFSDSHIDFFQAPVIDSSSKAGRRDMKIKGDITVENVHFTYPSRPDVPILRGMNLRVNAGQTVALVGSSGCGKSTIISLLLRYYDVLKGKITIDGVDVRDINLEFLRTNVAVVSQEPALFNCTIEENIRVSSQREFNKPDNVAARKRRRDSWRDDRSLQNGQCWEVYQDPPRSV